MSTNDKENAQIGCGLIVLGLLLALGCGGGCAVLSGVEYSSGHRDGVVQKLSVKGLPWHTREGEMALQGFRVKGHGEGASTSNVWEFSVPNQAVWDELNALPPDSTVRLHYVQYAATMPWSGATTYRVTRVERLK